MIKMIIKMILLTIILTLSKTPANKGGRSDSRGSNLRWKELGSVEEDDAKGEGDAHLAKESDDKDKSGIAFRHKRDGEK